MFKVSSLSSSVYKNINSYEGTKQNDFHEKRNLLESQIVFIELHRHQQQIWPFLVHRVRCSKLRGVCFDLVCMSVVMTLFLFPYKNGPISGACWIWGCMFCFCFCFGRGLVKKFCFFFLCTYHDFALTLDDNFSFLLCCFAFFVSFCILMTDFTQIRAILWLLLLLLLACVKIYL